MLQGRNLIIAINGSTIAAAKSCLVDVQADTIKVSSPTDGAWEHIIAGRKSWQVQTSHLMPKMASHYAIEAVSIANNGVTTPQPSTLRVSNHTYTNSQRGLTLYGIDSDGSGAVLIGNVDTYGEDYESACQEFLDMFNNTPYAILAITSWDAYGMTETLKTAIANALHVDMSAVRTGIHRDALAVIGSKTGGQGIIQYTAETDNSFGGTAHAQLNMVTENYPCNATTLKTHIGKVGTEVTLRMQVDGYGAEYVTGTAIVTAFKSQGSIGNLLTGSFTFKGNGPLQ